MQLYLGKGVSVAEVLEVMGGQSLKLDFYKSKWNNPLNEREVPDDDPDPAFKDRCPNSRFYGRFLVERNDGSTRHVFAYLRCKSWGCPHCSKVNSQVLKGKVQRGVSGCLADEKREGFRDDYSLKFFTGTLPGREWRDQHSREEAGGIIKQAFKRVVFQLRRKYGHFEYCWVVELQQDGFAHIHAVFIGQAVGPMKFKDDLESLWRQQQQLGFIKLKAVKGGPAGIASYLCKYMTKGLSQGIKGSHVYGASRGFYAAIARERPMVTMLERGRFSVEDGKYVFTSMWKIGDHIEPAFLQAHREKQREEEDDVGEQMLLPLD